MKRKSKLNLKNFEKNENVDRMKLQKGEELHVGR